MTTSLKMDIKCRMMSIWQKLVATIAETKNLRPCTRAKGVERELTWIERTRLIKSSTSKKILNEFP